MDVFPAPESSVESPASIPQVLITHHPMYLFIYLSREGLGAQTHDDLGLDRVRHDKCTKEEEWGMMTRSPGDMKGLTSDLRSHLKE